MNGKGWTCKCGAHNAAMWTYCEGCGSERVGRASSAGPGDRAPRTSCDCGSDLTDAGICKATGGYPATSGIWLDPDTKRQPRFACEFCRSALGWDGGCDRCHGTTTGKREDWYFPGHRYELEKDHWQKVDGPRKAISREQVAKLMAEIKTRIRPKLVDAEVGEGRP